jgi:hypothetical protein
MFVAGFFNIKSPAHQSKRGQSGRIETVRTNAFGLIL